MTLINKIIALYEAHGKQNHLVIEKGMLGYAVTKDMLLKSISEVPVELDNRTLYLVSKVYEEEGCWVLDINKRVIDNYLEFCGSAVDYRRV